MGLQETFAQLNLVTTSSERLQLGPRRRLRSEGSVSVAPQVAGGTGFNTLIMALPLETLRPDDGLVFDYVALDGALVMTGTKPPLPATSFVQIASASIFLSPFNNATPIIPISVVAPAFGASYGAHFGFIVEPTPFLSMRDLTALWRPNQALTQPIQINLLSGIFNFAPDASNTALYDLILTVLYRVVHGLQED